MDRQMDGGGGSGGHLRCSSGGGREPLVRTWGGCGGVGDMGGGSYGCCRGHRDGGHADGGAGVFGGGGLRGDWRGMLYGCMWGRDVWGHCVSWGGEGVQSVWGDKGMGGGGGTWNVMGSPYGYRGGGGHRDGFVWGGGRGLCGAAMRPREGGIRFLPPPHPPAQPSPPPTQPNPTQPGPPAASPPEPGEGIPRLSPPPRRLDGAGQGRCQAGRAGRTGSEPGGGGAARWGLPGARWDARARTFVRSGVRTHAA